MFSSQQTPLLHEPNNYHDNNPYYHQWNEKQSNRSTLVLLPKTKQQQQQSNKDKTHVVNNNDSNNNAAAAADMISTRRITKCHYPLVFQILRNCGLNETLFAFIRESGIDEQILSRNALLLRENVLNASSDSLKQMMLDLLCSSSPYSLLSMTDADSYPHNNHCEDDNESWSESDASSSTGKGSSSSESDTSSSSSSSESCNNNSSSEELVSSDNGTASDSDSDSHSLDNKPGNSNEDTDNESSSESGTNDSDNDISSNKGQNLSLKEQYSPVSMHSITGKKRSRLDAKFQRVKKDDYLGQTTHTNSKPYVDKAQIIRNQNLLSATGKAFRRVKSRKKKLAFAAGPIDIFAVNSFKFQTK